VINMVVQSRAFYDLAETLCQKNITSDEICYRTSINRAYYSAFHATKIYFNLPDDDEISHSKLIKKLKYKKFYLGNLLGTLFDIRKNVDYKRNLSFDQKDAENALKMADTIINNL